MEVNTPIIKVQSSQTVNAVSPDQEYAALHEQFEAYKRRTELEKLEADLEKQRTAIAHNLEKSSLRQEMSQQAEDASIAWNQLKDEYDSYKADAEAQETELSEEIASLQGEIASLMESIDQKDAAIADASTQISELQAHSTLTDSSLVAAESELETLRNTTVSVGIYNSLTERFEALTQRLGMLSDEYETYKENSVSKSVYEACSNGKVPQAEYDELESRLETLQSQYDSMQEDFLALTNRMSSVLAEMTEANDNYSALLASYNAVVAENQDLTANTVSKTTYEALQARYDALDASTASESSITTEQYSTIQSNYEQATQTIASLRDQLTALQANYSALQAQHLSTATKAEYDQLASDYANAQTVISSWVTQYNALNSTVTDLRSQLTQATSNYESALASLGHLRAEYDNYRLNSVDSSVYDGLAHDYNENYDAAEYAELETRYNTLSGEVARLSAEVTSLEALYNTASTRATSLQSQYDSIAAQLLQKTAAYDELNSSSVSKQAYDSLAARIAELTATGNSIEELQTLYDTLQAQYGELNTAYLTLKAAHDACEDPSLADNYGQLVTDHEELQAQYDALDASYLALVEADIADKNRADQYQSEAAAWKSQYEAATAGMVSSTEYQALQGQCSTLSDQLTDASIANNTLSNRIAVLTNQNDELERQISEMVASGEDPSTYRELLDQYNQARADLATMTADKALKDEMYTTLQGRFLALSEEVDAIKDSSVSVADYEALETNYNMLSGQYDVMAGRYNALLADIDSQDTVARSLHTQLQNQYNALRAMYDSSSYAADSGVVSKATYDAVVDLYNQAIADCSDSQDGMVSSVLYNQLAANYNNVIANGYVVTGKTVSQATYDALLADNNNVNNRYLAANTARAAIEGQYNDLLANSVASNRYFSLQNQYNSLSNDFTTLQAQYQDLNSRYNASSQGMVDASVYNALLDSYNASRVAYINLQTDYNVQAAALDGVNKTLDHLNEILDSSVERGQVTDGSYGLLYDQFQIYKELYTTPKAEYDTLLGMYNTANTNYLSLQEAYSALDASYQILANRGEVVDKALYTQLQNQYSSLDSSYSALQTSLYTDYILKSVYDSYVQVCHDNHISRQEYDAVLADVSNNNMVPKSTYDTLEANYNALDASYAALDASYNALDVSYQALERSDGATSEAYLSLQASYNALDSSYIALSGSYNSLSTSYSNLDASYQAKIADCSANHVEKSAYDALDASYQDLLEDSVARSSYEALDSSFTAYQSSHSHTNTEYSTLDASYNALDASYTALDASYDALDSSYTDLESNYNVLVEDTNYYKSLEGKAIMWNSSSYDYDDSSIVIPSIIYNVYSTTLGYYHSYHKPSGFYPIIQQSTIDTGISIFGDQGEYDDSTALFSGSGTMMVKSLYIFADSDHHNTTIGKIILPSIVAGDKISINYCDNLQEIEFYFNGRINNNNDAIWNNVGMFGNDRFDYNFSNNPNLYKIDLTPVSLMYIPESAFENCTSLTNIIIGTHVTEIEDYAFKNCGGGNMRLNITSASYKSYGPINWTEYSGQQYEVIVPSNITKIGHQAFAGTKLYPVTLPSTCQYYADSFPSGISITGGTLIS